MLSDEITIDQSHLEYDAKLENFYLKQLVGFRTNFQNKILRKIFSSTVLVPKSFWQFLIRSCIWVILPQSRSFRKHWLPQSLNLGIGSYNYLCIAAKVTCVVNCDNAILIV